MEMSGQQDVEGAALGGYKLGIQHAIKVIDEVADDESLANVPVPEALTSVMQLIAYTSNTFIAGRGGSSR